MNRKEIVKLLEVLASAYPNAKIKDAKATVAAWELTLGDFSAESVYKAARLHMDTNVFFPTPADIKDKIVRAELIYNGPDPDALESSVKITPINEEATDAYLEAFCKWIGFGCDPDDTVDLSAALPYEI